MPERPRSGSPRQRRRAGEGTACSRPAPPGGCGTAVRGPRRSRREHARRGARRAAGAAGRCTPCRAPARTTGTGSPGRARCRRGRARRASRARAYRSRAGYRRRCPVARSPSAKVVSFAWRRLREEPVGLLLAHRLGTTTPAALVGDDRVSTLAVGAQAAALAAGPRPAAAGATWVADRAGAVTRIDAESNGSAGEPIPVEGSPVSLAVGDGALWVANPFNSTVARIGT